ncbi:hypothetical protein GLYMA_03G149066v4 [Glycine max]|nr:hypothetical protein GLYMA_03G149066v4 [Glycine max]KAH1070090.1 hypothetical protein GYH30_007278 [Glycine max]
MMRLLLLNLLRIWFFLCNSFCHTKRRKFETTDTFRELNLT